MTGKIKNNIALIICIQEVTEDGSSMNLGNQLSEEDVSFLHQAFIADSISNALNLSKVDIKLFYSPKSKTKKSVETILKYIKGRLVGKKKAAFESGRLEVAELGPGRWGQKMDESFQRCFDQSYSKVLFMGSRTPTLTHHMITSAIKILGKKDVVFGPTVEGRYYMIGFAHDYHIALSDFDWRSSNIYSQVAAHIEDRGLSWEETEIWYAVEHPEDVEYLARDINHFRLTGDEDTARETERVLERILNRFN
jgi:hypothetical protein